MGARRQETFALQIHKSRPTDSPSAMIVLAGDPGMLADTKTGRTKRIARNSTMSEFKTLPDHTHRLGLALSGGGFRAALFHLGVIRFLREADLLRQVTHITSVSGGSVIGAHLALNWERYCGTPDEFQQASAEVIRFLQMDVRNRIVRRFPIASLMNSVRRLMRMQRKRQYTRAGLLEQHYEKFLYGDRALFNLPVTPQLYILATNLSEGSLCAFQRGGILLQKRSPWRNENAF